VHIHKFNAPTPAVEALVCCLYYRLVLNRTEAACRIAEHTAFREQKEAAHQELQLGVK
jgi:hypothetical protein